MSPPREIGQFDVISVDPKRCWWNHFAQGMITHGIPASVMHSTNLQTLAYHVNRLGVRRIVLHDEYICQDYLSDYSAFYSKVARPPVHRCVRAIFFTREYTKLEIFGALEGQGPLEEDNDAGLVATAVILPTAHPLLGRTVVKPHEDDGYITCREAYPCHLYGTPLYVWGLPWIEQDPSRFVCGGAALWVCGFHTQRKLGLSGHYSPGQMTSVARQFGVTGHVSAGMTGPEIATAMKDWGVQPYSAGWSSPVDPQADPNGLRDFVTNMHLLLESNISVVLNYWTEREGHAVVAMGHDLCQEPREDLPTPADGEIRPTSDWIRHIIAVDDQRAPFWSIPISPNDNAHQPLSPSLVQTWIGDSAEPSPDVVPRSLRDCAELSIYAPLPLEITVPPDEVIPLAQEAIEVMPSLSSNAAVRNSFKKLGTNSSRYALRGKLLRLWEFHWLLKKDSAMRRLAQDIREVYLSISWPTWIWVVQIIRISGDEKVRRTLDTATAMVVGEVLIDATATPEAAFGQVLRYASREVSSLHP